MSQLETGTGEHIPLAVCACHHQKEGIKNIDFVNRHKLFEGKTDMDLFNLINHLLVYHITLE